MFPRPARARSWRWLAAAAIACAVALPAGAQVSAAQPSAPALIDSARVDTVPVDTAARVVPRAPLSPRRAFIYSLLAPGYAQSVLGRPNAAALFVLAEAVTITMIRESRENVRQAQGLGGDSVIVSTIDPVSGLPRITKAAPRYPEALVNARKAQVEDWIAALVLNHLFSGADAFVAAHLWDVPAQLSVRTAAGRTTLAAKVRW